MTNIQENILYQRKKKVMKRMIKVVSINFLLMLLISGPIMSQQKYEPVNKKASPEAKALLDYLYAISGKNILSGHIDNPKEPLWFNRINELTGEYPAVWGGDFVQYYQKDWSNGLVKETINRHKDGYIITLMWHNVRPQDDPSSGWKESHQGEMTDAEWTELITPGTDLNKKWETRVDTIATYLKKFRDANIPILWRPYHEMNGGWFWWGDKKGDDGFVKLWKMMYDRFVNHHKLNNLIWVWNANAPRDKENDEAYEYELYFPGLEYVDVLAADVYHADYKQSHHDDLLKLGKGKVIALGEIGEVPSPEILANQPMWAWFMIWYKFVDKANTPEQIKDLYNYPKTLSHGEVEIR